MKNISVLWLLILSFAATSFAQDLYNAKNSSLYLRSIIGHSNLNWAADSIPKRIMWKPFDLPTVGVQAVSGIGFAAGAVALGYYSTNPNEGDPSGVKSGIAGLITATLGALALPTGLYFGGKWMGGNGGYWSTVGGSIVGGGLAILPTVTTGRSSSIVLVLAVTAALAGGIAGYNLSASPIYEANGSGSFDLRSGPTFQKGLHALAPSVDHFYVRVTILSIQL